MSNITINFNAPINIHAAPMIDSEDIQDLLEMVSDLECLICEMDDNLKYGSCDDEEQDASPAESAEDTEDDGVPMMLFLMEEIPEMLNRIRATSDLTEKVQDIMRMNAELGKCRPDDQVDKKPTGKDVDHD